LVFTAIFAFSATGCSQVSQLNKLQAPWADYEKFTYEVSKTTGDTTESIGTMTMIFERLNNVKTVINGNEFTVTGSACTTELNITAGENAGDSIVSKVAFKTDFTPIASYRESDIGGTVNSVYILHNTSKNRGTIALNGSAPVTFKSRGINYDNEMLYLLIRGSDLSVESYSMSFNLTNNIDGGSYSVSAARADTVTINTDLGEKECVNYSMNTAAAYGSGTTRTVSIAKSFITVENTDIIKPIVKITEGAYSYTLTAITTVKP